MACLLATACGVADGGASSHPRALYPLADADIAVPPGQTAVAHAALPFDARAGSVRRASDTLEKLVGHPVLLVLAATQSALDKAHLETDVTTSLDHITADLADLLRESPALASSVARLQRIVVTRSTTGVFTTATLSPDGRRLEIEAGFDVYPVLESGAVRSSFCVVHWAADDARLRPADADPTRLSPADQRAWFEHVTCHEDYLDAWLWKRVDERTGSNLDNASVAYVERLVAVLRLAAELPDSSPLEPRVRRFLVDRALSASDTEKTFPAFASVKAAAHAAYEKWLVRAAPRLEMAERMFLAEAIYDRPEPAPGCRPECGPRVTFAAFDRFELGMRIFEDWKRLGAPTELLPTVEGSYPRVLGSVFRTLTTDPSDRKRLVERVRTNHDALLLRLALGHGMDGETLVGMLDAVVDDDALFGAGFRMLVLKDVGHEFDIDKPLDAAALRWMTTARRGPALYIVAGRLRSENAAAQASANADFLARRQGQPIDATWLEEYLAVGPRALELLSVIWPVVEKTHARDDAIARHMPAFLDENRWSEPLRPLVQRICDDDDDYGYAKIKGELVKWVESQTDASPEQKKARLDSFYCRVTPRPPAEDRPAPTHPPRRRPGKKK